MIADVLTGLLKANLAAAAAVVAVLVLRGPTRRLFGARAAYGLWALPLLAALAVFLPHPQIATPIAPMVLDASAMADEFVASAAPVAQAARGPDLPALLLGGWIAGAVLMAGLLARRQVAFLGSLGRLELISGRLFRAERAGVGPAVVGVIRPRIIAPADFETLYGPGERGLILAHETAHLAAGDAAVNALACAAQCLGWFNPLAHVAVRLLRVDQELACDAAVIGAFPHERKTYAELLLKTQLFTQPLPLGCHWPAGAEHPLKARIAMLKSPLPARSRRAIGAACVATLSLAGAAAAWAAQPGHVGQSVTAAPVGAIPNNGHLEPAEAAKLVGPGQTMLCKPDENRELHNCKILGTPFTTIATAADVAREWPAAAKAKGLTGWVTLQCAANTAAGRLEQCSGYHYGGAAERPELKADFEKAAIRVISVIRLKTNPGPDDAPLPKTPGFYTIEFNDHPNLPGGPPANPPVTRYPDFLPKAPRPVAAAAPAPAPAARISVSYAPGASAPTTLILQPDWAQKPDAADVARVYPTKADQDQVGGMVVLDCRFRTDGRLTACKVASEVPPGDGFGAAALKLAEVFQARPLSRDGVAVAGQAVRIPIRFMDRTARNLPPGFANLIGPKATITRPIWIKKPTADDIARLYPADAAKRGLSGQAVLNCLVRDDGRLFACGLARVDVSGDRNIDPADTPDFGGATLKLAALFQMAPTTEDGMPVSGGHISIPVRWTPPTGLAPGPAAAPLAELPPPLARPVWMKKPDIADIARLYPADALKQGLSAMVVVTCQVGGDGRMAQCGVGPSDIKVAGGPSSRDIEMDFGSATLQAAKIFQMEPVSADGRKTAGQTVRIPVRWLPPQPAPQS